MWLQWSLPLKRAILDAELMMTLATISGRPCPTYALLAAQRPYEGAAQKFRELVETTSPKIAAEG